MLLGAAAGCGVGAEPPITVMRIAPEIAYNEVALPATIAGSGFRPTYRFDTGAGSTSIDVGGFSATLADRQSPANGGAATFPLAALSWESIGLLAATIPAGIPAGEYDLIVTDPRGLKSRLASAFTSLGVDTTPPIVTITSPASGAVVGAGAQLAVVVTADDGYGQLDALRVTLASAAGPLPAYDCPLVGGAATASCTFTVTAPAPVADSDMLLVAAQASGSGSLTAEAEVAVQLVPAPIPTAISPGAGSTLGGTLVTISGAYFVDGATTVTFDASPGTVYYVTPTSLTALAPPHPPGAATVRITTGGAAAALTGPFTYLAPPVAREVSPTSAPASGLVPIAIVGDNFTTSTAITFGGSPLLCPILVNVNRIEGYVPPGAGSELVTAYDPVAGGQPGAGVPFLYLAPPVGLPDAASPDAASPFGDGGCPAGGGP
jgi:large repetitive protein